jgi:Uma2 family endonuclease
MAIARQPEPAPLLTYEAYMAEGEIYRRYDILDGVRMDMPNPTRRHQDILFNVAEKLRAYERTSKCGKAILAPCDVLIRREPLRTRQPDVLFISHEQLAKCSDENDPAPLYAAPELVVEILSPSETPRMWEDKIADYCQVGVQECWMVSQGAETVEVLRLTQAGPEAIATYDQSQTLRSIVFPNLTIAVAAIFVE